MKHEIRCPRCGFTFLAELDYEELVSEVEASEDALSPEETDEEDRPPERPLNMEGNQAMETEMKYCEVCDAERIHHDGECLRCKRFREMQRILDALWPPLEDFEEDDGA